MDSTIRSGSAVDEMVIGDQIVSELFPNMTNGEIVDAAVDAIKTRILTLLIDQSRDYDGSLAKIKTQISVRK